MKHFHSLLKPLLVSGLGLLLLFSVGTVTSHAASRVNNYVYRNHLKPSPITYQIDRHLPRIPYRHGVGHPEGVIVHETANPNSNIHGEVSFMKHDWRNAFVHSFVDNHHIINVANTKYQAWGVGHPGNARFVQFEQIEVHNKRAFAKEVNNTAYYTAHLLKDYKLKPRDAAYTGKGTVWSHASVAKHLGGSDHTDPIAYYRNSGLRWFGQPYNMRQLYRLILHYYNTQPLKKALRKATKKSRHVGRRHSKKNQNKLNKRSLRHRRHVRAKHHHMRRNNYRFTSKY